MKNFAPPASKKTDQVLFLIRNSQNVNLELVQKLYDLSLREGFNFSLERLFKASESAMVIHGPRRLEDLLPELSLLELEDYLLTKEEVSLGKSGNRVNPNQAFGWLVPLTDETVNLEAQFLNNLDLKEGEQFFWQIIFHPLAPPKGEEGEAEFQLTARALVASDDKNQKIQLAKRISQLIEQSLQLNSPKKIATNPNFYDQFLLREAENSKDKAHRFSPQQILRLLKL